MQPATSVPCRECRYEVSVSAPHCINCGAGNPSAQLSTAKTPGVTNFRMSNTTRIVLAGVGALVLAMVVWAARPDDPAEIARKEAADHAPAADYKVEAVTKDHLLRRLKDPGSAQFRGVHVSHRAGAPVLCGEINSKNSFGGYTGFERFAGAGNVIAMQSEMTPAEFEKFWAQSC
jgi:hypothetical protein